MNMAVEYAPHSKWRDSRWAATRSEVLAQYPNDVQGAIKSEWMEIASAHEPGDIGRAYLLAARANIFAAKTASELSKACVGLAFDEELISQKAKRMAQMCLRLKTVFSMRHTACSQGIEPPDAKKCTELGQKKRLQSEKWWRRKLHTHTSRVAENSLRERGLVHKKAGLYCTDATLKRRKAQKARQRDFMNEIFAVNDIGDVIPMVDIIDSSTANPVIRRAEFMTRISGFEDVARAAGHCAEFLTMTSPSRFHCRYESGRPNPKYICGNDPRASQEWLCSNWARIRAHLKREDIAVYGFRIAEPHHDGTTHWHLLLFVEKQYRDRFRAICRDHLLRDQGNERGAKRARFKVIAIDPSKGTAAGYCAKYVAKNIDGHEVGDDHESENQNATDTARRVDAWASLWGIRQFQQIGGPPVGLWRELRRITDTVDNAVVEGARSAADEGNWQGFIEALGGISVGRGGPVVLEKEVTGEINEYDEMKPAAVVGVRCAAFVIFTRDRSWFFVFGRDFAAAWTCVNNCTQSPTLGYAINEQSRPESTWNRVKAPP